MHDFTDDLRRCGAASTEARRYLRIDDTRARPPSSRPRCSAPDLWDDQDRARQVTGELAAVSDDLDLYDGLAQRLDDAETLASWPARRATSSQEPEIDAAVAELDRPARRARAARLFTGEYDEPDAICAINAGPAAPTPRTGPRCCCACTRAGPSAAASRSSSTRSPRAPRPASSSAELIIKGRYAYGLLQAERGAHRLVRICPFDAKARRQTASPPSRCPVPRRRRRRSRSTRRTSASTPTARRAPAASTST